MQLPDSRQTGSRLRADAFSLKIPVRFAFTVLLFLLRLPTPVELHWLSLDERASHEWRRATVAHLCIADKFTQCLCSVVTHFPEMSRSAVGPEMLCCHCSIHHRTGFSLLSSFHGDNSTKWAVRLTLNTVEHRVCGGVCACHYTCVCASVYSSR